MASFEEGEARLLVEVRPVDDARHRTVHAFEPIVEQAPREGLRDRPDLGGDVGDVEVIYPERGEQLRVPALEDSSNRDLPEVDERALKVRATSCQQVPLPPRERDDTRWTEVGFSHGGGELGQGGSVRPEVLEGLAKSRQRTLRTIKGAKGSLRIIEPTVRSPEGPRSRREGTAYMADPPDIDRGIQAQPSGLKW